ncbi:MAG: response regulator [Candidatus Hatepunaea meridiana]|nr:response regulator [Candidatus Hatepunaea meridiana]
MAIITIFSGSYCNAEEIVEQVSKRLNPERLDEKLFAEIQSRFGVSKEKLMRTMTGFVPFMNKVTHEQEKNIAYLKAVLSELILEDNKLLHGSASQLLPKTISHLLKVCIIANFDYRQKQCMQITGKSEKDAHRIIHNDDTERGGWTKLIHNKSPYDEDLFDIIIPMQDTSVSEAVDIICDNAGKEALIATTQSLNAVEDYKLATDVNLELIEAGHYDVDVTAADGKAVLTINKYVVRLEQHKEKLSQIAAGTKGVNEVQIKIGKKYTPPSIIPMEDFEMPSKILLVDDEMEFVHTLSERLEARNLESSVVYDGEQALEAVRKDEPEVMVLDLKMPGIDGIEVLRHVKKEHPLVEVIILTGHGSEREKTIAEELGAFAYLNKPVDINVLTKVMKEAYQKVNAAKRGNQ